MIRKAKISDVGTIMTIINETVKEMKSYGNNQWDENYPNSETFINDIKNDSLYVYEEDNNIKGFICIDCNQAAEYENLNWSLNEKCMVAHRIAVNTKFRNSGIATKLMSFCEELALKEGIIYIKTEKATCRMLTKRSAPATLNLSRTKSRILFPEISTSCTS